MAIGIGQVGDVAVIVAAQQPALGLGDLEHRLAHRHPEVGALDQHEAAAHGKAVDRGDDRLLERARHEGVLEVGPLAAGGAALERFLHVLAGAEAAAGAGEDGDLEFLAVAELGPGLGKLAAHFMTEGIQPLGSVHADHEHLSVTFGLDDGHVFSLRMGGTGLSFPPIHADRASPVDDGGPHDDDRRLPVRRVALPGGGRAPDPGLLPLPQLPKDQRRGPYRLYLLSRERRGGRRRDPELQPDGRQRPDGHALFLSDLPQRRVRPGGGHGRPDQPLCRLARRHCHSSSRASRSSPGAGRPGTCPRGS